MSSRNSVITQGGFTLVELLFAIFIFAIVISSVYGSYRATFHIVHNSEAQVKVSQAGRVVLARITEDLQSLAIGPGGFLRGEQSDHSGQRGDNLSFISSTHIALRRQDVHSGDALIQYSVEPEDQSGLLSLYRSDTVVVPGIEIGEENVEKHLVCSGVFEIRFTYIDKDENENEEWLSSEGALNEEEGTEQNAIFPILIYVELTFADSLEGDNLNVFKTAVAIPQRPDK